MNMVYSKPVDTVTELGTSDHNMVLLEPSSLDTSNLTRMSVKSMVAKEKATFELALSLIKIGNPCTD